MMRPVRLLLLFVTLAIGVALWWRRASSRRELPCPAWLAWVLDNPVWRGVGGARLLDQLDLTPGMRVLDVGSGPGRLSLPAAARVAPRGEVVALDLQPGMLDKLRARAAAAGVTNIRTVLGGAGQGHIEREAFDRALLVTVLGEIPDRAAALREIHAALKPGGVLAVAEILLDPHFQSRGTLQRLATAAGFQAGVSRGNAAAYTLHLVKPTTAAREVAR